MVKQIIPLFILIAGYIVGLGSTTVIDLHGFLGRKSSYWTKATIATHKVTKPLIWIGIFMVILGSALFYGLNGVTTYSYIHWGTLAVMLINGVFLSFWVSPKLIEREKKGMAGELLPNTMQKFITISFVVSAIGWWGSLILFIYSLSLLIK